MRGRISAACVTTSRPSTYGGAGRRGEQRGEDLDERGLAGAVGAEQAEEFAGPDLERYAVERDEFVVGPAVAHAFPTIAAGGASCRCARARPCGSPEVPSQASYRCEQCHSAHMYEVLFSPNRGDAELHLIG